MAQWSDPRVTGTQSSLAGVGSRAGDVAFDAGLRSHMLKVYNYMASGVLLTGIVAMLFAQTELAQNLMLNPSLMSWVIISVTSGRRVGDELWPRQVFGGNAAGDVLGLCGPDGPFDGAHLHDFHR
jgi:hypothetical protein